MASRGGQKRKADGQPGGDNDEKKGGGAAAGGGQRLSKRQKQERVDELLDRIEDNEAAKAWAATLPLTDELMALDPNNHLGHFHRGYALDELNRPEEAIAAYTRSLELTPDNLTCLINRSRSLFALRRYEEAIADCTRAIQLDSKEAMAYNNRAAALRALNKLEESVADYNKAMELGPRNPLYRRNRADTLIQMHQYDRALADCTVLIKEMHDAKPDELAMCHCNRERCREALKHDLELALADYRAALVLRQHLSASEIRTTEAGIARLEAATKQQSAAAAASSSQQDVASSSSVAAAAAAAAAPRLRQPRVSSWSAQQASEWIRNMGKAFEPYAAAFVDDGITGKVLVEVLQNGVEGHALLEQEVGIRSKIHRVRIIADFQDLMTTEKQQAEQKEKEEKDEKRRERNACSICVDRERCMTFLPCGHLCACEECAKHIMAAPAPAGGGNGNAGNEGGVGRRCPICKQLAKATQKVFLS